MKKSTLVWLLIAAAAVAAVWYFEFKREKPPEPSSSQPAFAFKEEDVTALRIERRATAGQTELITLERKAKDWRISQPLDAAPDPDAVSTLLFQLTSARFTRSFPASQENLNKFGFPKSALTLHVQLKSGATHRLEFAEKDFSGTSVYARRDSAGEIILLPAELLRAVDKPLLEFRDRRIAVFNEDEIARLRVKNQHVTLAAERNAEGKWLITEPATHKGKELLSTRVFLTLENARAEEILDALDAATRRRLAAPQVTVELFRKDGASLRYAVAPAGKDFALFSSSATPLVFKIRSSQLDTLNFKPADVLREPEPPPAPPEKK
jgi:hypothetical protein